MLLLMTLKTGSGQGRTVSIKICTIYIGSLEVNARHKKLKVEHKTLFRHGFPLPCREIGSCSESTPPVDAKKRETDFPLGV